MFEMKMVGYFIENDTKRQQKTKRLSERYIFGFHCEKSRLGLQFASPADRNLAEVMTYPERDFTDLGSSGSEVEKRPAKSASA